MRECVCVCVFRKAACSLLLSLQLVMFCAAGKEGKKGGIRKKTYKLTKKTYWPWPFVVMICTPPVLV